MLSKRTLVVTKLPWNWHRTWFEGFELWIKITPHLNPFDDFHLVCPYQHQSSWIWVANHRDQKQCASDGPWNSHRLLQWQAEHRIPRGDRNEKNGFVLGWAGCSSNMQWSKKIKWLDRYDTRQSNGKWWPGFSPKPTWVHTVTQRISGSG